MDICQGCGNENYPGSCTCPSETMLERSRLLDLSDYQLVKEASFGNSEARLIVTEKYMKWLKKNTNRCYCNNSVCDHLFGGSTDCAPPYNTKGLEVPVYMEWNFIRSEE